MGVLSVLSFLAVLAALASPAQAQTAATANLWISTGGGSCTRSATPAAFNSSTACGTFQVAYSRAQGGDTVRVRTGTYPAEDFGGSKTPPVHFIGEPGAGLTSGSGQFANITFLTGNVILDGVNITGALPTLGVVGANNTWQNATMTRATRVRDCGNIEPITIYNASTLVANTTLRNLVIEEGFAGQCSNDIFHLENIRIDQNVDGVVIDRVTFKECVDCGSGHIFITSPSTTQYPRNITITNSIFEGSANFGIQTHRNITCLNWTVAYNTWGGEPVFFDCASRSNVRMIGNAGPRPQNCESGVTWTRNVWQWGTGNPCGTDKLVIGPSFSTSALKLDSNWRPLAGSPVIDAGETAGGTSYCSGGLGAVDRDNNARPVGSVCDAGAFEFGAATAPQPAANVKATVRPQ